MSLPYSLRCVEDLKYGIWIEVVELVASFDPKPVAKCDATAEQQWRDEGDGVGRREKKKVCGQGQGRYGMEREVGDQWERFSPVWQDEVETDLYMRYTRQSLTYCIMVGQGLTARRPQYRILIRHSMGALVTLRVFFTWNSAWLPVMSASKPTANVAEASERPMMVRYCRCQP
jgi:hypothetical protein